MRISRIFPIGLILVVLLASGFILPSVVRATPPAGYYLQPALHGETIVFVAEGDLWKVPVTGGVATRLTSHPGDERSPVISPNGSTVAFSGQYEGPTELYTMPLSGGLPVRWTYDGEGIAPVGWMDDGRVLATTAAGSTLPDNRLVTIDVSRPGAAEVVKPIPLSQGADGCTDDTGRILFFTRLPFQGSHTKRYQGGTAQKIWRFADGDSEATCLTPDWDGTSRHPSWWRGRIFFESDRDGTMNIWSMDPSGRDLKQHTRHEGWDVAGASLADGRIVYQLGADLYILDIASGEDRRIPITLDSDLDQTREHWIEKPIDYMTSAHISADGERIALTARGRVFVAPRKQGRLVEAARKEGVRYRAARFLRDGKNLIALSDESGEVEFWRLPSNGVGAATQLTSDGEILRWDGTPSPDGKCVAHIDKNQRLYVLDLDKKTNRKIDESKVDNFSDLAWSPDGKWLAYVAKADNFFRRIRLYGLAPDKITDLTSDRFDSYNPVFSPDGKWLYFLSDRNLRSIVGDPWGSYQPEPFLDRTTKIYQIALAAGERSPFAPSDELHPAAGDSSGNEGGSGEGKGKKAKEDVAPAVKVDLDGIAGRLIEVPVPAGNYGSLAVNDAALFWLSSRTGGAKRSLEAVAVSNDEIEVQTLLKDVASIELSQNGKRILVRKGEDLFVIDAGVKKPEDLDKKKVDLSAWSLSVVPAEEWRQMFAEAWRLERDYFYDPGMHGIDWKAMRAKYEPLVERVRSRGELADLIGQMVSELGALHTFVYGGDARRGEDKIRPASLGAVLRRDDAEGGVRVAHIYANDPDEPEGASPLARPNVDVKIGDLITMVDGVPVLSVPDIGDLLRQKAGRQVLLRVRPASAGASETRDVIVKPITPDQCADLRYREWEYTRRRTVEDAAKGEVGYVHLRAMGGGDYTDWAKGYYPAFIRKGLIIDVRHNNGGNIDSWILGRLLRKAWFYWSQRVGESPDWNMQYAFRGHVVVLCDESTYSDGEAFAEGIRRLGIGKIIGTRTWGGEIWLSSSNNLVDHGIATAAESGVYGPEGKWLIEGHGVDPDIVVDNLPHATFEGGDAQLARAVAEVERMIREEPVEKPAPPNYPDKSFHKGVR